MYLHCCHTRCQHDNLVPDHIQEGSPNNICHSQGLAVGLAQAWALALATDLVVHQDNVLHRNPHKPGRPHRHQLGTPRHMHCTNLQGNPRALGLAQALVLASEMGLVVHRDNDVHKSPHKPCRPHHHQLGTPRHMHCTNRQGNPMAQDLAWAPVQAQEMGSVVHQGNDVHKNPHKPGRPHRHQLGTPTHMQCTSLLDNPMAQDLEWAPVLAQEMGLEEHQGNDENMNPHMPGRSHHHQLGTQKHMHHTNLQGNHWVAVLEPATGTGLVQTGTRNHTHLELAP